MTFVHDLKKRIDTMPIERIKIKPEQLLKKVMKLVAVIRAGINGMANWEIDKAIRKPPYSNCPIPRC